MLRNSRSGFRRKKESKREERKMCGINRISFEELKKAPVSLKVMYGLMTAFVATGLVLIMVDIFAVESNCLTIALAFIVASQIINVFGPCRYAARLNRKTHMK
jgi:hypothetical protein